MDANKRVGIMGGTFNPIHNGHLILANAAKDYLHMDTVLFIPTGNSYMKHGVLDARHRYEMTCLAIEDIPSFQISDIETRREGHSYSCETLKMLHAENPKSDYYFIMGADSLYAIENWYQPEQICSLSTLVCAARDQQSLTELTVQKKHLEQKYHAKIVLLPIPRIDISSSMIRSLCAEHQPFASYLPPKVLEYIQDHHLYQQKGR